MRIRTPVILQEDHRSYLSAEVQTDHAFQQPDKLWFSIRGADQQAYQPLADPFLIGLLPNAMKTGEAISVDGPVSTRLAHGIEQYQDILSTWWPEIFTPVKIEYKNLQTRHDDRRPAGVGCCFSGGVDSFYTVLQLTDSQQKLPGYQLTHALMINGFDQVMDFDGDGSSQRMFEVFQPVLANLGAGLLMLDSNLKYFRDAVLSKSEKYKSYGSILSACAHACSHVFGRFGISGHATYRYGDLEPVGSHPVLDHHLSSDQLQLMHIGSNASRTEKIAAVAEYADIRRTLRVCFGDLRFDKKTGVSSNCGRCEKCIRTLVSIELLGKTGQFNAFTSNIPMSAYRRLDILALSKPVFLLDNLELAKKMQRHEWVDVLEQAFEFRQQALRDNGIKK